MDGLTLLRTIERVRRAMPRNSDVMSICAALESLIVQPQTWPEPEQSEPEGKRFDKKSYQRNLMRKRRAKAKEGKSK